MGYRCYWTARVRKKDRETFEGILRLRSGNVTHETDTSISYVEEEADYGNHGLMLQAAKAGCIFYGNYGPGTEYGSYIFASDGTTYAEWETGYSDNGYVITPRIPGALERLAEAFEDDEHHLKQSIRDLCAFLTWYDNVTKQVER